jgi:hypothetical protein
LNFGKTHTKFNGVKRYDFGSCQGWWLINKKHRVEIINPRWFQLSQYHHSISRIWSENEKQRRVASLSGVTTHNTIELIWGGKSLCWECKVKCSRYNQSINLIFMFLHSHSSLSFSLRPPPSSSIACNVLISLRLFNYTELTLFSHAILAKVLSVDDDVIHLYFFRKLINLIDLGKNFWKYLKAHLTCWIQIFIQILLKEKNHFHQIKLLLLFALLPRAL